MGLGKRTRKYLKHRVKKSRFTRNKNNIKQGGNKRVKRTLNKTRKIGGSKRKPDAVPERALLFKDPCLVPTKIYEGMNKYSVTGDKYLSIISFKVPKNEEDPVKMELTNTGVEEVDCRSYYSDDSDYFKVLDIRINVDQRLQEQKLESGSNSGTRNGGAAPIDNHKLYLIKIMLNVNNCDEKRKKIGSKMLGRLDVKNYTDFIEFYVTKEIYDLLKNTSEKGDEQERIYRQERIYKLLYDIIQYNADSLGGKKKIRKGERERERRGRDFNATMVNQFIEEYEVLNKLEKKSEPASDDDE